jgi:hypothetical protein
MEEQNYDLYQEPVYSKKVLEMLTVANEYCLYLEKAEDYTKEDILQYLQKLIPLVYLKASLLPDIEVADDSVAEHFVTEEQWETLFNTLRIKFGKDDIYYMIDREDLTEIKPFEASISENLSDIYQDLKDFILLYQKPLKISKENAVKDCRELFIKRTGFRLVNVHQAVHYLLYGTAAEGDDVFDFLNN